MYYPVPLGLSSVNKPRQVNSLELLKTPMPSRLLLTQNPSYYSSPLKDLHLPYPFLSPPANSPQQNYLSSSISIPLPYFRLFAYRPSQHLVPFCSMPLPFLKPFLNWPTQIHSSVQCIPVPWGSPSFHYPLQYWNMMVYSTLLTHTIFPSPHLLLLAKLPMQKFPSSQIQTPQPFLSLKSSSPSQILPFWLTISPFPCLLPSTIVPMQSLLLLIAILGPPKALRSEKVARLHFKGLKVMKYFDISLWLAATSLVKSACLFDIYLRISSSSASESFLSSAYRLSRPRISFLH